jgi:hypothetical protein
VTAVLFALSGWWAYAVTHRADVEERRADTAVSGAEQLCEQVRQLGGQCVVDPASLRGETGPRGPQGPPPSDDQVRAAVEEYFARNPPSPGRPPTPAEIAVAVINYLTEHPPAAGPPGERGPGPTAQQIGDAVREYLTANPPAAGPQGEPGQDGQDATPEMVAEAVEAYIAEHPLPVCPEGTTAEAHTIVTVEPGMVEAVICVRQPVRR